MSSQLLASAYDVLSGPANGLLGRTGDDDGASNLPSPTALGNLSTWYDVSDKSSLTLDGSDNCQLIADKSGNSSENCLVLPGVSGNYASFTALTAQGTNDFSLSWKVSVASLAGNNTLFGTSVSSGLLARVLTTGEIQIYDRAVGLVGVSTGLIPIFTDTVIGYTRSGTTGKFYINGVLDSTITDASNYTSGISDLGSYASGTSSPLNGLIKWARVYSAALDATAMAADAAGTIQANNTFAVDFADYAKLATSVVASTGQTVTINTTAIALPARIHGARDLYMGTAASQPKYLPFEGSNYGYSNGGGSDYYSTPDSPSLDITGDIDLTFRGAAVDWTPATIQAMISKSNVAGNDYAYNFYISADGKVNLAWSPDATVASAITATSSVATGITNGATSFVRATLEVDNGDGGYTVRFYLSDDDSVPLGTPVIGGATTSIAPTVIQLAVGRRAETTSQVFIGNVYSATVKNGIGGTTVASFAASDYPSTGGSTFTSSETGETWTINGGAKIVTRTGLYFDGTADYMKSAAFALSQPENVYFVGEQVTWTINDKIYDGWATGQAMALYQATSTPRINMGAGAVGPALTALNLQTAGIVAAVVNSTSSLIRLNRNAAISANAGTENAGGFTLGAGRPNDSWANCFVSEIVITDTVADDTATQDRIALYEGQKWGIIV